MEKCALLYLLYSLHLEQRCPGESYDNYAKDIMIHHNDNHDGEPPQIRACSTPLSSFGQNHVFVFFHVFWVQAYASLFLLDSLFIYTQAQTIASGTVDKHRLIEALEVQARPWKGEWSPTAQRWKPFSFRQPSLGSEAALQWKVKQEYNRILKNWYDRRKFRSQTSDNMDTWKSRGGKSQRGEEKKWEDQRRERVRSKKMQVREKVGKSRFTVLFPWFGAPEGRKVTSLKRRVQSQLARWEIKKCTPLWREAHFQVKMCKTHCLRPLLEVQMSKKCTPLWREAHFQVKSVKNWRSQTTFRTWDVEKVHAVVARNTFPSQKCKTNWGFWAFFDIQMSKKWTLTNLTNWTNLTNLPNLANAT